MIHESIQYALRTRARTLTVATTGSISMSATGSKYVRTTGSFVTDGFSVGMELSATGFALAGANGVRVVEQVSALELTMTTAVGTDSAASGRTLLVGLPAIQLWENIGDAAKPVIGRPFVEEQYIPGPMHQHSVGPLGMLHLYPMYNLQVHAPANVGVQAPRRYADKVLLLFTPRTAIAVAGGHTLRVRSDTGPFIGQMQASRPGWVTIPVTIPLWIQLANTI